MPKTAFRSIGPLLALFLILGACMRDEPALDALGPTESLGVRITSPAEGTQIEGNLIELAVEAQGVEIGEPDDESPGSTAQFYVFINQDPVASGETISNDPGIVRFAASPVRIPGLGVGRHKLTVVLGDGSDMRMGRVSDSVEVEVRGPSIDATAPAAAPMATGFTITTEVQAVRIVAPEEDAGLPGTGHLDLIINPDEDPEPGGQPLPSDANHIHTAGTTHEVTGLPAGEHTIWVVLTDKDHVPVSPMVADKVVVTIR